jgi:RNA polymerase sigma-70 factor (ECF subfamily)
MPDDARFKMWLDAARKGDVEAFGFIVPVLRPGVARIVARYAHTEEDREDLLQEVFIRAFSSLKNYRGKGSFEGWLRKLAVGTSIDWLRSKTRRKVSYESELTRDEKNWLQERFADDSSHSPETATERNFARQILYKALDKLSPEDRTAITLFELEGMNIEEVASVTGWSHSNVKVRCHRARKRLASFIREEGGYFERE